MQADSQLIAGYIQYLEKVRCFTPTTVRTQQTVGRRWTGFLQTRSTTLRKAGAEDVLAWMDRRQRTDGVGDRSIERELCILRTFYEYLKRFEGPCSDPCGGLPEFICKPPAQQDYVRVDEMFKMLESCNTKDAAGLRNYVIIALLWSTGLRSSELCGLQWRDIDLEEGTLLVRKAKGNKQRQLFLNDRVRDDLRLYRRSILAGERCAVFCDLHTNDTASGAGRRLTQQKLSKIIHDAARAAGITRRTTTHMLRHSFATHMYEAGVSIADLAEMMGHTEHTETTIYIHVGPQTARRLLNAHVSHTLHYRERP